MLRCSSARRPGGRYDSSGFKNEKVAADSTPLAEGPASVAVTSDSQGEWALNHALPSKNASTKA
jgi:hypothetical protein